MKRDFDAYYRDAPVSKTPATAVMNGTTAVNGVEGHASNGIKV
ncbi:hypothetical protein M7I_1119 [Glarea lozoyensis 74030]|uniref:Uncharacterized protein n=1 Tax=Glarea lozoyensis (strain ATCC 74030 / MF5533) TaxID=1104152 RepID=H0EF80_GLAL7|nr:hypothetical protein M7I_1119 [Glarea lozoyensis 74030]